MAAGPGAILFMVLALLLVAAVVGIEAVPVGLFLARQYQGIDPSASLVAALVLASLSSIALCVTAAWLPMHRGGIKLWGDLGNVGD
jgi:hypothetical protein